jgi:hypothetical protein
MHDYSPFLNEQGQNVYALDLSANGVSYWPAVNANIACNKATTQQACIVDSSEINKGYYSVYPLGAAKKLRLVLLSTTYFSYKLQDSTAHQLQEAERELTWLHTQLQQAKNLNEKVYLAMHIPPGTDPFSGQTLWTKTQLFNNTSTALNVFLQDLSDFQSTIVGIFYGHTHSDTVRRFYNSNNQITNIALGASSITPYSFTNASMRLVNFDNTTFELKNYTVYYTTPIASNPSTAQWGSFAYTFNSVYGCVNTPFNTCLKNMTFNQLANDMYLNMAVKSLAVIEPRDHANASIEVKPIQ